MRDIFMTVLGSFLLVFVGAWNLNADVSELVKGKIFIDKSAVSVGDTVKKGDVICILEAMKAMNEIKSDRQGVVKEILVQDAMTVEFDQPLFVIE